MLQKQPHDSGAVKDIPDRPAIVPATVTEIPNMTYLDTLPHSRPQMVTTGMQCTDSKRIYTWSKGRWS